MRVRRSTRMLGGNDARFKLPSARSMSHPLRHAGYVAARSSADPHTSSPLAGEAASLLALDCQPITSRATTTINGYWPYTRSRGLKAPRSCARIAGRSADSQIGVVFTACSHRLFASTEGAAYPWRSELFLLAMPPNHAFERTRLQRGWLRAVLTDQLFAPALPPWWRAAQRRR